MIGTGTSTLMKLAVSVHWTGVLDSNGNWDEDITIGTDGVGKRGRSTIDSRKEIATRINTDLDVADAGRLDFFYRLFTPEMFATIAGQMNQYARMKITAIPSLPCRK